MSGGYLVLNTLVCAEMSGDALASENESTPTLTLDPLPVFNKQFELTRMDNSSTT